MKPIVLETRNLSKTYDGRSAAVSGLDLVVRRGEIYGLLGRNGAGKSTTLRMAAGLLEPSGGGIALFGEPLLTGGTKHYGRLGIMLEHSGLYPQLSARDNLLLHCRLMGVSGNVDEALRGAGLDPADRRKVKELSGGTARRLILARTLLHGPELLVLDEPTIGLDPHGTREFRRTLKELAENRGVAVLLSSHILSEIQNLAARLGILHNGELLREVEMASWRQENRKALKLRIDDARKTAAVLEESFAVGDYILEDPETIKVYEGLDRAAEINRALNLRGVMVSEMSVAGDDLEGLFIALTGGDGNA